MPFSEQMKRSMAQGEQEPHQTSQAKEKQDYDELVKQREIPVLQINVKVDQDFSDVIDVYYGDKPAQLAEDFYKRHGCLVNEKSRSILEREIRSQMESLTSIWLLSNDYKQDQNVLQDSPKAPPDNTSEGFMEARVKPKAPANKKRKQDSKNQKLPVGIESDLN